MLLPILGLVVASLTLNPSAAVSTSGPAPAVRVPEPIVDAPLAPTAGKETAVLSGGCFWGVQAVFEHVKGVIKVTSGFSGGDAVSPSYEEVSTGQTGHAESVQIEYDPSQISYGQLLKVFFSVGHDPTQLNRQGPDVGTQYRSAIWYSSPEQEHIAKAYIDQLKKASVFPERIVTEVSRFKAFYPAEAYHQDYYIHHPFSPYIVINDKPKVENLKSEWPGLYVEYKG
jgi:peptide-methionine (S)-S-oxide reductase